MKISRERENIKRYLLGDLADEEVWQNIERRLMTDDVFAEEMRICEDELIDDYLERRLTEQERTRFENHFLISPERRERLQFARTFKTYLAKEKTPAQQQREKKSFFDWLPPFIPTPVFTALVVLLLCGIGLAVYLTTSRPSDLDKGLSALKQTYRARRPFEARIAEFDYAPFNNLRGGGGEGIDNSETDTLAYDRAQRLLLDAVAENKNAAALHALGKFYLSEKNFDKAINLFESAAQIDPNNPQLQSDFGAALLEAGKKAATEKDGAKSLESFARSLEHLEKSIKLAPRLLEPRFNRALCLEAMFLPEEAKRAWREYLELDPNSPWAKEARRNLERLEAKKSQSKSGQELLEDFLTAFRGRNDEVAWLLQSRNKEIFTGKLIHRQLAAFFLDAKLEEKPAQADEFLQALIYLGELESQRATDNYFADLAAFYKFVPKQHYPSLREGHKALSEGLRLYSGTKFNQALKSFQVSLDCFNKTKSASDAKLSQFLIAFVYSVINRTQESTELLTELIHFHRAVGYKWLLAESLYRLVLNHGETNEFSKAIELGNEAISVCEETHDTYNLQRNVSEIARIYRRLRRFDASLDYIQKSLQLANSFGESERQKYRNYDGAARTLFAAKLYYAAAAFAGETLELSQKLNDPTFEFAANLHLGIIRNVLGRKEEAFSLIQRSAEIAASIKDEKYQKISLVYANSQLGHAERQAGNYEKALKYYDDAIELTDSIDYETYKYEARKGKLLCYAAQGDNARLETELPIVLELFEEYRTKIFEEQNRNSFFDTEQEVYDIAADFEFSRGNYEQAYDYVETSRARSLLDWLTHGTSTTVGKTEIETTFKTVAAPLRFSQVSERMPEPVQIVQYKILKDKVLIWLVSRNQQTIAASEISEDELNGKVKLYLKNLASRNIEKQKEAADISRELYRILITPVWNQIDKTKEICFIPDKILFHLPFAALQSPESGNYLIADFTVFFAPSANIFILTSERSRQKNQIQDETLLSIGNPTFNPRQFPDLQDSPTAEHEAQGILLFYSNQQTLIGKDATKQKVKSLMQNADVVHFAGHFVSDKISPLHSSFVLAASDQSRGSENSLASYELARETLPRTRLMVLSACQTGVEGFYEAEGMIGVSRSLLAAGVPLVVASQWKVDSPATAELMLKFHRYRRQAKLTTTTALRRAQLDMLMTDNEEFRQPYFWAAFAAFGGYANF